jgi:thymidylate synthase
MKILAIVQGNYGKRMAEAWQTHGPAQWEIETLEITSSLPTMMEDTSEFLPRDIPKADLVISLGEHPGVAELLPAIVKAAEARAVIAPVDNRAWLPPGLAKQVEKDLQKMGVPIVFPVTFCALLEGDSDNPLIQEFARHFGYPEVEIGVEADRVKEARVIRSAPCGNTYFVAEELKGTKTQDAEEKSGILHHNYPCLATMNVDWQFHDTLMHRAGYFTKQAVKQALKKTTKR